MASAETHIACNARNAQFGQPFGVTMGDPVYLVLALGALGIILGVLDLLRGPP